MSSTFNPNTDPYGYLGFTKNPDGSISRLPPPVPYPASPISDLDNPIPVLSKDIIINPDNNTWARVFLPRLLLPPSSKLPLIVNFHGGGLVICSPAREVFHHFCCEIAEKIPAVVVSVGYRLAPEHRVPAAYENGVEALHWIKSTTDEWVADHADLSNCFLMGSSAGGNVAYHVALRMIPTVDDFLPVKIRGMILHQPFFGGVERTPSEIRLIKDAQLPLAFTDILWDLALPVGANRDNEYCNPTAGINSGVVDRMRDQRWKVLVTGFEGDPLIDRQKELAGKLKEKGIEVIDYFKEGGYHGFEFRDKSAAEMLYGVVKDFVRS